MQVGNALSFWLARGHRSSQRSRTGERRRSSFGYWQSKLFDVVGRRRTGVIVWVSSLEDDMNGNRATGLVATVRTSFIPRIQESAAAGGAISHTLGRITLFRLRLRVTGRRTTGSSRTPIPIATRRVGSTGLSQRFSDGGRGGVSEREFTASTVRRTDGDPESKRSLESIEGCSGTHRDPEVNRRCCSAMSMNSRRSTTRGDMRLDTVLATIAERIASSVRDSDVVGRIGGDDPRHARCA